MTKTTDLPKLLLDNLDSNFLCKALKVRGPLAGLLEGGTLPSRRINLFNHKGDFIFGCSNQTVRDAVHIQKARQRSGERENDSLFSPFYAAVLVEWTDEEGVINHDISQLWLYQVDHL